MFNKKISLLVLTFMAVATMHADDFANDPFSDDIFKEMYQMQKEMDKIFERMQQRVQQPTQQINLSESQALMPSYTTYGRQNLLADKGEYYEYNTGVKEGKNNQIDISIEEGVFHFKATIDTETKTEQSGMHSQQRYVSMVQRSQILPKDADESTLKSEYKNGILILTIQKTKSSVKPANNEMLPSVNETLKSTTTLKQAPENKPATVPEIPEKLKKYDINGTKIKVPHTISNV